jgi:hypothetical protein
LSHIPDLPLWFPLKMTLPNSTVLLVTISDPGQLCGGRGYPDPGSGHVIRRLASQLSRVPMCPRSG